MFATYDVTKFPNIFVTFSKDLSNDADFYSFTNEWTRLYEYEKPFVLIFNTIPVEHVSVKYCFYMAAFIKKIRRMQVQYLQKSFIIVKNKTILNLLEIIFYLQPPVADVFICDDVVENNFNIIKQIPTSKPFLTFL